MVLSIGIHYDGGNWKTCLMEKGRTLELLPFSDVQSTFAYLQSICALYPEPMITLSSGKGTLSAPLYSLTEQQLNTITSFQNKRQQAAELDGFLRAVSTINLSSYSLPAVRSVPTIPAYRKHNRLDMGTSNQLCTVTTLLHQMRKQEAIWQEMRFLYLDVNATSRSIVVVEDGRIVNGLGATAGAATFLPLSEDMDNAGELNEDLTIEDMVEQAFWEGLAQDLAGLMAIHHLEDIVVTGSRKDAAIGRLEDRYQFYHFPHGDYEHIGFETAIGAAVIAEGLYGHGLSGEIVERLQLSQVSSRFVNRLIKIPLQGEPVAVFAL